MTPEEVTQAIQRLAREVRLSGTPRETVEKLFQLDVLYGDYLYLRQNQKLVQMELGTALEGALTEEEQRLVSRYKAWCRSDHGFEGDCLGGALVRGKYMDTQGRYMLAMALSKSPVLEEFEKALGWVGAKTLYNLITGWFQLMEEVKVATTFEEIREASEKFGKLFSREAAQAFAMVAMALLTRTAKGFAEQVGTLPGSAQVSMRAAGREGILLSEVSAAESVTVTAEGFSVALAPGAVAMTARGARADRTEKHHIATIANEKSTLPGGPWTPLFEELFARAGMRLTARENTVPIKGHKGPHPQRYHDIVFGRLQRALGDCSSVAECRARLVPALDELAKLISTPGTELNRLVTLGK